MRVHAFHKVLAISHLSIALVGGHGLARGVDGKLEDWEREDLIKNLSNTLAPVRKEIADKMIDMFAQCDPDYGKRVAEGIEKARSMMPDKGPIGSTKSHQAVKQAEEVSREGKPY